MKFDEAKHEYTHNGSVYISTTQLLKKYGLSANYTGIPKAILDNAAKKGNAVHKGLELFIGGDQSMLGLLNEVDLLQNYVSLRGIDLTAAKSEQLVFDDVYKVAGTVDFQYVDGNENIIADFKTTSSLHLDAVAWQLSIYNYLVSKGDIMTYYFNKLKVFHFNSGKLYVRDVYMIEYEAVKALLEANQQNLPTFTYVKSTKVITSSNEILVAQILNELEAHQAVVDKLKKELSTVLDKVKENMIQQKDYTYDTPDFVLTYVHPQNRRSLDSAKVKQHLTDAGLNVNDFMKETVTKDDVRAKLKKTKQTDGD